MQFDIDKAKASIKFLIGFGDIPLEQAIDLLYIADYNHINKYGRTIFGGTYMAELTGIESTKKKEFLSIDTKEYSASNYDNLSFSDTAALSYAISFKKDYTKQLKDKVWEESISGKDGNLIDQFRMAKFMDNADDLHDHFLIH